MIQSVKPVCPTFIKTIGSHPDDVRYINPFYIVNIKKTPNGTSKLEYIDGDGNLYETFATNSEMEKIGLDIQA